MSWRGRPVANLSSSSKMKVAMRHFRFGKLLVLFLLALATALPSLAEEPNRRPPEFWGPRDGERFRERGEHLLAKNPRSVEGLNMMGMLYIVDWRVNDDAKAASYFQKSWSVQPNPTAALALAQIAGRDRGEDSDENVARWALRAMEFPGPSLTALALFERAVNSRPELAKLETAKVRKLRAHRQRWRGHVKKRTKTFPHARVGIREEDRRLPADEERTFELLESEVVAKDKNGGELWRKKVEEPEVKLVATGPRVFVISPDWVEVWNAADGSALHKWPSLVKTDLASKFPSIRSEGKVEWEAGPTTGVFGSWHFPQRRALCIFVNTDAM